MQGPIIPRHTLGVAASSLSGNFKNFVYFSTETRGVVGKAVKIDSSLFGVFLSLVDPTSYTGQQVIRAIVNLRCSLFGTNRNAFNAFEHLLTVGSVAVRYRVTSEGSSGKDTIYIAQVRSNHKSQDKAGFYAVSSMGPRIMSKEVEVNKFEQARAYIAGADSDGKATDLAGAQTKALSAFKQGSGLLVYGGGAVINDLGIWKANETQGAAGKQMVTRLREALELNADSKKEWIAEGEGAALLLEAVMGATGDSRKSLSYEKLKFSNYSFRILNPNCDTAKLLGVLRQKNAQISENVLEYSNPGRAARVSALSQFSAITQKLATLGSRTEFNAAVTKRFTQAAGQSMAQYNAGRLTGGSGGADFVNALTQANRAL